MIVRNRKKRSATSPRSKASSGRSLDPTMTTLLRKKALDLVRRKFALLKGRLVKLVAVEDAFGLRGATASTSLPSAGASRRTTGNSLIVNPFVSEAQRRACYAKDDPDWDCEEWESKTESKLPKRKKTTENSFCPTGEGGGVDPTCSPLVSLGDTKRVIGLIYKAGRNLRDAGGNLRGSLPGVAHKVFISDLYDAVKDRLADDVTLTEFKAAVGKMVQRGLLEAGRQDLVAGESRSSEGWSWQTIREKSEDSATSHPGSPSVKMHHVVIPHLTINRFQFESDPDKILAFQKWLREQFGDLMLGKSDEELWAEFARRGYERGAGRAFDDVNKKRRWAPGQGDFYDGTKQQFLRSAFGRPESTDKLRLLAGRSFTDLRNVTEDMAARMQRTLMDGLARGANPRDLVDDLVDDLDVSEARAETIARTEIIRAHAEGQLDAFEKLGVEEVGVAVEWSTAGDDRVCRHCAPLEGVVLTVAESHGLIPAHPNCRCAFIPANVGEDTSDQKRSKAEILDAFAEAEVEPPELDDERPEPLVEPPTKNAFCPTGPGGGIDPTCSPGTKARLAAARYGIETEGISEGVLEKSPHLVDVAKLASRMLGDDSGFTSFKTHDDSLHVWSGSRVAAFLIQRPNGTVSGSSALTSGDKQKIIKLPNEEFNSAIVKDRLRKLLGKSRVQNTRVAGWPTNDVLVTDDLRALSRALRGISL